MKPIDMIGFGPKREVTRDDKSEYILAVTPPKFVGDLPTQFVKLSEDQFRRYKLWLDDGVLIQNALHDLTIAQREIIMTGLGEEDFAKMAADDEE